ncbi:MAG: enoyl-CoA hydratase [Granulosicoccus sp.]
MSTDSRSVDCIRKGHRADIVFNNPRRHNAMSLSMWAQLDDALQVLASDLAVRAVVFSGAGEKAFVSGADISEFDTQRGDKGAVAEYNRISEAADLAVCEFPKPTIAKIRGYCLGGGLGLALGADIRICSEDSSFAIPAGKLGLGYNFHDASRLLRLLGPSRASELLYTAKRIGAEEALQIGLVNQVVPAPDIDAVVDEMVETVTSNAPLTLAAFKAASIEWMKQDNQIDHESVSKLAAACYASADYAEGRMAFGEKRKPVFNGK